MFDFFKRKRMKMTILKPDSVPQPQINQFIDLKNETNEIKRLLREQDAKLTAHDANVLERLKQIETVINATREALLERLQSNITTFETHHTVDEKSKIKAMVDSLSLKERKLFALLMQSGALNYHDIAHALKISPTTARGLVHRILIEPDKAQLFTKVQDDSGNVKIAIKEEIENSILRTMPIQIEAGQATAKNPDNRENAGNSNNKPDDQTKANSGSNV